MYTDSCGNPLMYYFAKTQTIVIVTCYLSRMWVHHYLMIKLTTCFHLCASTLTTYVLGYLVRGLHVCLVLRPSCLSIYPILTLTISIFTVKLLGMLLKDSCLKYTLLAMLIKDIHDNSTTQQYLPYSINILKILSNDQSIAISEFFEHIVL